MSDSKTIRVPGVLVERCEEFLEDYGFNSLSELVRDLLRDWSEAKKQEQTQNIVSRQLAEAREEEMERERKMQVNALMKFKNLLDEGEVEEAEDFVTYLLEGGEDEKS